MEPVLFPAPRTAACACRTGLRYAWRWLWRVALLAALSVAGGTARRALAHAEVPPTGKLDDLVGLDQQMGAQVPLDLALHDEQGRAVRLEEFVQTRPVILVLGYFHCNNLCPLERQGLAHSLQSLDFRAGQEFEAVLVSIDPAETAAQARTAKQETLAQAGPDADAAGWHFLTGDHAAIDRLAGALGYRYAYDPVQGEYAHPSGLVILTPAGRIARYFFGIEYAPRDLRLALVEASANQIGSPLDQFLLLCYRYDPQTGRYTPLVMNIVRIAGGATVVGLVGLILALSRHTGGRRAL
jgi:protein SCO1/2